MDNDLTANKRDPWDVAKQSEPNVNRSGNREGSGATPHKARPGSHRTGDQASRCGRRPVTPSECMSGSQRIVIARIRHKVTPPR
jgi:hypothetical protein